jgi:NAD-dependent SIR2 family protein deacetylase
MEHERRHDMGEGGFCICLKCGEKTEHRSGIPCREERCPKCGTKMIREGSEHHRQYLERKKNKEGDSE